MNDPATYLAIHGSNDACDFRLSLSNQIPELKLEPTTLMERCHREKYTNK
jgi:hypothetical protein